MSAQELQELGMDESRLAAKTAQMDALVSEPKEWHCQNCGITDSRWMKQIRKGAEVEMSTLYPNQRVGYGTGGDNHALYTHACGPSPLKEQLKASVALVDAKPSRKRRSDAGKPKPKAPAIAQQPGFLSAEQASRLTDLINSQETRRAEYDAAQDHVEFLAGRLDAARQELYDYLLHLQGKK